MLRPSAVFYVNLYLIPSECCWERLYSSTNIPATGVTSLISMSPSPDVSSIPIMLNIASNSYAGGTKLSTMRSASFLSSLSMMKAKASPLETILSPS